MLSEENREGLLTFVVGMVLGAAAGASITAVSMGDADATFPSPLLNATWFVANESGIVIDSPALVDVAKAIEPGRYTATGFEPGKKLESVTITVARGGTPIPPPGPVPPAPPEPPGPTPTPVADLWGVVVEESGERTWRQASLLADDGFRKLFSAGFRVLDDDSDDAKGPLKGYIERSAGKQLPMLFIATPAGVILHEGPLPTTVAEAAEIAKRAQEGRQ
jgi:hypothetical protein